MQKYQPSDTGLGPQFGVSPQAVQSTLTAILGSMAGTWKVMHNQQFRRRAVILGLAVLANIAIAARPVHAIDENQRACAHDGVGLCICIAGTSDVCTGHNANTCYEIYKECYADQM